MPNTEGATHWFNTGVSLRIDAGPRPTFSVVQGTGLFEGFRILETRGDFGDTKIALVAFLNRKYGGPHDIKLKPDDPIKMRATLGAEVHIGIFVRKGIALAHRKR